MGTTGRSKLLVTPRQLLTMAFGLAKTCLGNAVTIWFLLPFLLECLNSFIFSPIVMVLLLNSCKIVQLPVFWLLITVNSILIFVAFASFTFPTNRLCWSLNILHEYCFPLLNGRCLFVERGFSGMRQCYIRK